MTALNELGTGPDPEMYTHLTDHVFEMILATAEGEEESKLGQVCIMFMSNFTAMSNTFAQAKKILESIHNRRTLGLKFLGEICDTGSTSVSIHK